MSPQTARTPLGVGFIGAGPVTQSIHLPALARHTDKFSVVHVNDIDAEAAERVAGRTGARSSTDLDELLADERVDIVAVCSPHQFHAEQVIRAFQAGKMAVFCEKPLAMSAEEAKRIAAASAEYGVPLIVGAMHHYDAGWVRAWTAWKAGGYIPHTVRSTIVLPPNSRFEDFAVESLAAAPVLPSRRESASERAESVERGVVGLAVHDLPLIRALAGGGVEPKVLWAESMRTMGYRIVFTLGATTVELFARMYDTWRPQWTLEAFSDDAHLAVEFTPSYVLAGSASGTLARRAEPALLFSASATNGYEGEWLHLAEVVHGSELAHSPAELIDDLTLTLNVAALAGAWIRADEILGKSAVA